MPMLSGPSALNSEIFPVFLLSAVFQLTTVSMVEGCGGSLRMPPSAKQRVSRRRDIRRSSAVDSIMIGVRTRVAHHPNSYVFSSCLCSMIKSDAIVDMIASQDGPQQSLESMPGEAAIGKILGVSCWTSFRPVVLSSENKKSNAKQIFWDTTEFGLTSLPVCYHVQLFATNMIQEPVYYFQQPGNRKL